MSHHHEQNGGCPSCACQSKSCTCSCHQNHVCGAHLPNEDCGDKAHQLLAVADMAWLEVLKEKIKEYIKANDHKIDEIAKIVAEANCERWKQKMAKEKCCASYEDKLNQLFCECDSSCSTKGQSGNNKR